ncbi:MAG: undecaprenyldiphospho-muramoylpentapeptide beta-N-acetylglucosaminyltransferase [Planctomycetaceae bacterium]|nr:undecaprenyldiphospho-muramoylpentapeptide beta-N-acetylglucosaminyltransferase [Planctomycetaceae bacterium]
MDATLAHERSAFSPPVSWSSASRRAAIPVNLARDGVFVFAGGGTGGHLFPGIALAETIRRRFPAAQTIFAGTDRAIERRIVESHGLDHRALSTTGLQVCRRRPDQFVWRNWRALMDAGRLVQTERPQVVIGLGGFASAPVVWAAHRAGVPIVLLEQNAIPGRATCWLSRLARVVCTTFAESADWLPQQIPTLVCGNPVRREIAELCREPVPERRERPHLLVLGGSLGADGLNTAMMDLVRRYPRLREWTILHQTGPRQLESVRSTYADVEQSATVADFFEDMTALYRQADIVISRAGATTLAELACAGRPTILVPYPQATDNHQQANAESFVRQGAAVVIAQSKASPQTADRLWSALKPLMDDPARCREMSRAARATAHPDAADRILDLLQAEQPAAA